MPQKRQMRYALLGVVAKRNLRKWFAKFKTGDYQDFRLDY